MEEIEHKLDRQRLALQSLIGASRRLAASQRATLQAITDRNSAIRDAMDSGLCNSDICTVTGLTRGRLSQIKNRDR